MRSFSDSQLVIFDADFQLDRDFLGRTIPFLVHNPEFALVQARWKFAYIIMRLSCNGCRVLRKGCSESCVLRPCLQWIRNPESQANATAFLAKFYGRTGLTNLICNGPEHLRPDKISKGAAGRFFGPDHSHENIEVESAFPISAKHFGAYSMADRNLTPAGDATSLASSSSTLESNINSSVYDVFINHRGPDVKKGLASHIYRGLIGQGLRVFLDQRVLQGGEKITPQIEGAIRTASVHIAIFSPGYAKSRWCLDELLLMVKSGSTILPVFYKVQPSELRWTRGEDGVYARALRELQNKRTFDSATNERKPRHDSDTIEKWRKALYDVSEISGFELKKYNDDEGELVYEVVQQVLRKMDISLPRSLRDMEVEVERLNNLIHDINVELDQVQMNPKRVVKAWLDKAGEAIESSQSIRSDYQQHKICTSCCPDCYKISKRIIDLKVNVDRLHREKESDFPPNGEYGDSTPPTQIPIHIPRPGFVGDAIESAQSKLEEWLITKESNIRIIGVHGMGGVGKTSLLQKINNSQKVSSSFDLIIWVTVSQEYNISDLQDQIAKRLRLENFAQFNSEERKYRLSSCLKNCLLILDDMWKSLELQSLGVSLDDSSCKIVLSTRDKEVCTSMGAKDIITVEPLSEEKAWELFCSRAFGNESVPQEIEDIARGIAGECKGLPLAINVVAAAMANYKYSHEWELCLSQIQNVDERFYGLHNEIEEKLFQRLKWSYNGLQEYLKTCFVYFAAYPEDTEISCEEVIDIWIAEGLVKGSGEIYLRDIGHSYINFLRDRCLIEVVWNDFVGRVCAVKIHDILRDLAILIAEKEHRCYFKAGQGLSHFPSEEDSEGCARMSLMKKGLHSLPTTFRCSSLSVLLLGENNAIEEVPGSFLNELRSLRVLDLCLTGITSLPPCIENLKHLASLQLKLTYISELPEIICDLKELQFLNVSGCPQLRFLPERISELKSLRALDIGRCKRLSHLPRGISELVTLERLTMMGSRIRLDFEEEANAEERKYGCLKDLQSLRRLRVLEVQIKSPVKEGVMGNWSKMRDLKLYCYDDANQDYLPQDMQLMKDLERFTLDGCDVERLPSWVSDFRKLAYLQLSWCKQLKELPAELPCLRELSIGGCDKLEELELGMGFPKLQELTLECLESLECVGAVAAASGSGGLGEGASPLPPMLKSLEVFTCPKLKRLRGGWDKLKCLKEIRCYQREWWDAIQWEDANMKASLESKFRSLA